MPDALKNTTEIGKQHAETLATILIDTWDKDPRGYTKLLDLLAKGKPLSSNDVADSFGYPRLLVKTLFYLKPPTTQFDLDDDGNIIGSGLTSKPTKHHFTVRGNPLYTWCAFDTLLFPLMLNEFAQVKTPCLITGTTITFSVTPEGIQHLQPKSAVIAFVIPDPHAAKGDIQHAFCQFANLFKHHEAALEWKQQHPNALILSAQEGFALTQHVVETLKAETKEDTRTCVMQ